MAGNVVAREACPACRERGHDRAGDNLARFADGGATCFRQGCDYYETKTSTGKIRSVAPAKKLQPIITDGTIESLPHRAINDKICGKYNYRVLRAKGVAWEIASYYDNDKQLAAQKVKNPETKEFFWRGDPSKVKDQLYGSQLINAGGPILVVTEGELDAMAVCAAFDGKYPAVSIPSGAQGAAKVFQQNIDLLNSFDKVVIYFDNDEQGIAAAKEAAEVLNPGKAYFASIPEYKDANEALMAHRGVEITKAVYQAREFRPDGIVHIRDVPLEATLGDINIFDFPFECMTQASYGLMGGEVVVMASGSGMGKSTVIREMIYNNLCNDVTVGALMLEESNVKTKQDIGSIHVEQPIHLALTAREVNRKRTERGLNPIEFGHTTEIDPKVIEQAQKFLEDKNLYVYDHWGSVAIDVLLKRLNFMAYACGCEIIYIDHLSIIVSGQEGNDERRDLDRLMAELKAFAQRTGVAVVAICHLKKSASTPHEEGGQVSLNDFRGSGALYQYADKCFGFERNQQSGDDDSNVMKIRMLKNRFAGTTGVIGAAKFYPARHRLIEIEYNDKAFGDET